MLSVGGVKLSNITYRQWLIGQLITTQMSLDNVIKYVDELLLKLDGEITSGSDEAVSQMFTDGTDPTDALYMLNILGLGGKSEQSI